MTHFTKLAAGLTGLAAIAAVSSPATAQINPYGQVGPYGSAYGQATPAPYGYQNNGGVVGAIVGAVTGYGRYPQGNYGYEQTSQRNAVEMCARSAEQRLNTDRRYSGYGYGQGGYNNGYVPNGYAPNGYTPNGYAQPGYGQNGYAQPGYGQNGYGQNGYRNGGMFRVVGITNVERRSNGALRVRGIASSDTGRGNTGWNQQNADDQRDAGSNGYAYGNDRYQSAGMDYRFTCKIDSRGVVTSLNLDRGMRG